MHLSVIFQIAKTNTGCVNIGKRMVTTRRRLYSVHDKLVSIHNNNNIYSGNVFMKLHNLVPRACDPREGT